MKRRSRSNRELSGSRDGGGSGPSDVKTLAWSKTPLSLPFLQGTNEARIWLYARAFTFDEVESRVIRHVVGVD